MDVGTIRSGLWVAVIAGLLASVSGAVTGDDAAVGVGALLLLVGGALLVVQGRCR